jgi:hypothetical protein
MQPHPASSNKESWQLVVQHLRKYPDTEHWKKWQSVIGSLIDRAIKSDYDGLFRAVKSMNDIRFSTLDNPGAKAEPHVKVRVTVDWRIQVEYVPANYSANQPFGPKIENNVAAPPEAFQVFTRYLQHLWSETMAEPIPTALRGKRQTTRMDRSPRLD